MKLCGNFQAYARIAPTSSGGKVKIGNAYTALAHWNLQGQHPTQRGAVLFAAFWIRQRRAAVAVRQPFKASDPVHTPFQLNTAN